MVVGAGRDPFIYGEVYDGTSLSLDKRTYLSLIHACQVVLISVEAGEDR